MKRLLTSYIVWSLLICIGLNYTASAQNNATPNFQDELQPRHSFLSVSTNALYDAILVPNVGVELNLYNNFTLSVNGMWAWWTQQKVHWYWRVYGGEVALKKYLGKKADVRSMTGHHIGVYGQAMSFDFEAGHFGTMSPKLSYGGGIEYGYSFPISNIFNIDVSLGVGYLGGQFYEYVENEDHYVWRATLQQRWFGPTKANVSLVWLLESKKTR